MANMTPDDIEVIIKGIFAIYDQLKRIADLKERELSLG